jgi:hypothetical protein
MDESSRNYYEHRERVERAAAKSAANVQARRVHQQLAMNYAAVRSEGEAALQREEGPAISRLTILTR